MSSDAHELLAWRYLACPLEGEAERFGPFRDLVSLWRARRPAGAVLPPRAALDFYDLTAWLGRVFIAEVTQAPFDLRVRLWGTELTRWWGVDYTGKTLGGESRNPDLFRLVEFAYFEAMAANPFIGIAAGRLDQHERAHIKVMGLDLPLGAADGRLTHVLSAHIEIALDQEPETLIPELPVLRRF
ncbi:MAG: PAS domain-containing protein [Marivibrio sp.]|uniref:PAS domain-containing protein n=1 Tax=Marivibrio sp. TaxID=2039719 RepID=UPI0032EBFBCE